jgi:5-methylcytosine-specific restriction enzyme subunit McrC
VKAVASNIATLFEYEPVDYEIGDKDEVIYEDGGIILSLTEKTMEELEKLNKTRKFIEITRRRLRPLNYVGVIKAGEVTLEIFPKFITDRMGNADLSKKDIIAKNLLKMLQYTHTVSIREIDYANIFKERHSFFEVFISIFARNLLSLLKCRQNREYMRKYDEIRFVKGKIDFRRYTNPARLHLIPCTYHERTADNIINRVLKYTAYLMSRIVEDRENYRTLRKILDLLDSITLTPITIQQVKSISFNRLNADFKPFIDICSIFLEGSTLTLQASTIETFSLLIPMESLFEQFIAGVIQGEELHRNVFGDGARIEVQKHIGYLIEKDGKKLAGMKPDIVIKMGKEKVIIDTKYKLLNQEDRKLGVSQQDLYQVYAYCRETNAKKALLLYPEGLNKIDEINLKRPFKFGKDRDIELYVRTVSLEDNQTSGSGWESFVCNLSDVLSCLGEGNV